MSVHALGRAALSAGIVALTLSASVGAATADPTGHHPGTRHHHDGSSGHRANAVGKAGAGKPADAGKPASPGKSEDAGKPASPGKSADAGKPADAGEPKGGAGAEPQSLGGNNGTVKITPVGEDDGIPQNSPHPGCGFQIEWYGFDEGSDIVSEVTFTMQAPTSDVGLSVTSGDTSVAIGGDPASGAGTDTGLDGREVYSLAFDGAPHPKQGYHVKVLVTTPRSNGAMTKSKVFWVGPCSSAPGHTLVTDVSGTPDDTEVAGVQETAPGDELQVAGVQAEQGARVPTAGAPTAGVPTEIDAGEDGGLLGGVLHGAAGVWPLGLLGAGTLLGLGALAVRRRGHVGTPH